MNFQRINACVLAPEVVVRRVDDWTVIAFASMTFDRLHHGARIGIGARRSLAVIVGDAWPAIMRPHRHEIRNADPVEVGHAGNFGNADGIEDCARGGSWRSFKGALRLNYCILAPWGQARIHSCMFRRSWPSFFLRHGGDRIHYSSDGSRAAPRRS